MGTWFHVIDPKTGILNVENSRDLRNRYGQMDDAKFKAFIKQEQDAGRIQGVDYPNMDSSNPQHDAAIKRILSDTGAGTEGFWDGLLGDGGGSQRKEVLKNYAEKNKLNSWTGGEGLKGFGTQFLRGQTPMQQSAKQAVNDVTLGFPQLMEDYTGLDMLDPTGAGKALAGMISGKKPEQMPGEYNRNINRAVRDATTGPLLKAAETGAALLAPVPGPAILGGLSKIPGVSKVVSKILPKVPTGMEKAGVAQVDRVASKLAETMPAGEANAVALAALRRMAQDGTRTTKLDRLADIGRSAATAGLVGTGYGAGSAAIGNIGTEQKQDVSDAATMGGLLGTGLGGALRSAPHLIEAGSHVGKGILTNFGKKGRIPAFEGSANEGLKYAGAAAKAKAETNIPKELELGFPVESRLKYDLKNSLDPAYDLVTKKGLAQSMESVSGRGSKDYGNAVNQASDAFVRSRPGYNDVQKSLRDVQNRYDSLRDDYLRKVAPENQQSWYPDALEQAKNASIKSTYMHPDAFNPNLMGKPVASDLSAETAAKIYEQGRLPKTVEKVSPPRDPGIAAPGKKWPQNASPLAMRKEWTPENWNVNRPTVQEVPNPAIQTQSMDPKAAMSEWAKHFGVADPMSPNSDIKTPHYKERAGDVIPRLIQAKNVVKENARALQNPAANQLVDKKLLSNIANTADTVVKDPRIVGKDAARTIKNADIEYEKFKTQVDPLIEKFGVADDARTAKNFEQKIPGFIDDSSDDVLRSKSAFTPLDNASGYFYDRSQKTQKSSPFHIDPDDAQVRSDLAALKAMQELQDRVARANYVDERVNSASGGAMGRRFSLDPLGFPMSMLQKAATSAEKSALESRIPGGVGAVNQELYDLAKSYQKHPEKYYSPAEHAVPVSERKFQNISGKLSHIYDGYTHPVSAAVKGSIGGTALKNALGFATPPTPIVAGGDVVDSVMQDLLNDPNANWEKVAAGVSEHGLDMDSPKMKVYLAELTKKLSSLSKGKGSQPREGFISDEEGGFPQHLGETTVRIPAGAKIEDIEDFKTFWENASNEDKWAALREQYKSESEVPDVLVDMIIDLGTKKRSRAEVREILKKQLHR